MPELKQEHTILVVDDDITICLLLSELLSEFGSVELAGSGQEALQKVVGTSNNCHFQAFN